MDFDDLQALLWAHAYGSLQSASRATGVSRATLRRRLERLEAAVGRPTHVVGPEGITLTAAGHALVEEGVHLLDARQRLLDKAQSVRSPQDSFRVLVQVGLPPRAVATAATMATAMLPGVVLHLDFDPDPPSRQAEPFDAFVHWGEAPLLRAGFTRTLLRTSFHVLASSDYLAAHGTLHTPADLARHRILHLAGSEPSWQCLDGQGVEFTPTHVCSDLYVLGLLAGQGLGLALLPVRGPLLDDSIDALLPVLKDHIRVDRGLRVDIPVPSRPDSASAALIRIAETFGHALTEFTDDR